jgi:hypothetical protein
MAKKWIKEQATVPVSIQEPVSPVVEASEKEVPSEVPGHQDALEDVPGKYLKLKGIK